MSTLFLMTRTALIFSMTFTFLHSSVHPTHAASSSEMSEKESDRKSPFLTKTLTHQKQRVLKHMKPTSGEEKTSDKKQEITPVLTEEDQFVLDQLKQQPFVSDFLSNPDAKTRQSNLVLSILGVSGESLFTYDEDGEINWISMIHKIKEVPLESLNLDTARLLVADFLTYNDHFSLPLWPTIFGKLFHASQTLEEGKLPKDAIEQCLFTCYRRNLHFLMQQCGETLSDFDFNQERREIIGLYAEHIVKLADRGGKNAQEYVLGFFNQSPRFKEMEEIWRSVAPKIPEQNSEVCPDEDRFLEILKSNMSYLTPDLQHRILSQFKTLQFKKAIVNGVMKVHGPSVDITQHYGLQGNTYALILTSLWNIENSFLRHYQEYREQNCILEEHGKKESKIQAFLSNTAPDAQAALHNFLAIRTVNILHIAQSPSKETSTILKNLEGQEKIFRSFSSMLSPHIQSESAKFLLSVYDARLMRDLHKRFYGKPYVLYQGEDNVSGEVTQILPFYMNPNWKLAEVTGLLLDESFDQSEALDFIDWYARQGYREAQEALARFSKLVGQIESKEQSESNEMKPAPQEVSLEQLFALYNAQLVH